MIATLSTPGFASLRSLESPLLLVEHSSRRCRVMLFEPPADEHVC